MPVNASEAEADPPSRIAWPPRLVIVAIALGALLDAFLPLSDSAWPPSARVAGGLIVALALANDVWCALLMRRQGTTMRPDRAVSSLVIAGPFRWSRNPIYVSHVALVAGLGLALRLGLDDPADARSGVSPAATGHRAGRAPFVATVRRGIRRLCRENPPLVVD